VGWLEPALLAHRQVPRGAGRLRHEGVVGQVGRVLRDEEAVPTDHARLRVDCQRMSSYHAVLATDIGECSVALNPSRLVWRTAVVPVRVMEAHSFSRGRFLVASVRDVAAGLRAAVNLIPTEVVARLNDDLVAVVGLLQATIGDSSQRDAVAMADRLRQELIGTLEHLLGAARTAMLAKAHDLAASPPPVPAPSEVPREVSRKVQQLRGKPPPRGPDHETNEQVRAITNSGWVVQKTAGNHLTVYGPAGEGPYVFSSTPSGTSSRRKLRELAQQIRNQNEDKDKM
jgi:hypothetical protein